MLSFALSGIYVIVDGFFVGNSIGDLGLSAINISYLIVAVVQALGTGIGMGGAIYYSICKAEKKDTEAKEYTAGSMWLLIIFSFLLTVLVFLLNRSLLKLLGAEGKLLALGEEYIAIITLGATLQVVGTGLVPFIRNSGSSFWAMIAMIAGFVTNIIFDYLFVWVLGQGITLLIALLYLLYRKQITLYIPFSKFGKVVTSILKIGIAPFGLAMSPNISLIIINRFSVFYGGESAVVTYAYIAYVISIIYLILQGVGDGSQPLISYYYGEKNFKNLLDTRKLAYGFAIFLSLIGLYYHVFYKKQPRTIIWNFKRSKFGNR